MPKTTKSQKMAASTMSLPASLQKAEMLLSKLRALGYIPEQLPKLEDGDALYMALRNKRRTGKFYLD